jgi:hypothetical protein
MDAKDRSRVILVALVMVLVVFVGRAAAVPPAPVGPIDFVFSTAAIDGATPPFYTFTADEITITSVGLSVVTQFDTSAPFGVLGATDDFVEVGFVAAVNFQLNEGNVFNTGLLVDYELIAEFTLAGTTSSPDANGNIVITITSGIATIFYDEVLNNTVGPGESPIGTLTEATGDCVITAASNFAEGTCKLTFLFDGAGPTDPGVWTFQGKDLGDPTLQPVTFTLDINVDKLDPPLSLLYPDNANSPEPDFQVTEIDHDGSAVIHVTPGKVVCPNDSTKPGSVLVFHKFIKDGGVVVNGGVGGAIKEGNTSFSISVTCPTGEKCDEGQPVRLHAQWVCPGSQDLSSKFICKTAKFPLDTTVKGTVIFNPDNKGIKTHSVMQPPCKLGYLIVWVVDESGQPIKFDGLVGKAVIREDDTSAGAYNPLPIQACPASTGDLTDLDKQGDLDFDGVEYAAITGKVQAPIRFERSKVPNTTLGAVETHLTLLTLDVKAGLPNLPTFVDLHFFNAEEVLLSTSHEFICWSEVRLKHIDANLSEFFGKKGFFESTEAEKVPIFQVDDQPGPVTLIGIVETKELNKRGEVLREWAYSLFNDAVGVNTVFQPK